jgi:Reverse gyrase
LVSEEFTRELEQKMDIISEKEGEDYKEVLKTLYDHLKFNIIFNICQI